MTGWVEDSDCFSPFFVLAVSMWALKTRNTCSLFLCFRIFGTSAFRLSTLFWTRDMQYTNGKFSWVSKPQFYSSFRKPAICRRLSIPSKLGVGENNSYIRLAVRHI